MRADAGWDVKVVGGDRVPGDIYNTGKYRVPLRLEAGSHVLVFTGVGGRGAVGTTAEGGPNGHDGGRRPE